jgi:O-antigen ligase
MSRQKKLMFFSLLAAVITLPWSTLLCHMALGLFLVSWVMEGQWKQKSDIMLAHPLIWPYCIFILLHILGVLYSDDTANGWFNVEKKLFFFALPVALATTLALNNEIIERLFKAFLYTCLAATAYCLVMAYLNFQSAQPQNNFNDFSLSLYQQLNPEAHRPWMSFSYIGLSSGVGMHPTFLSMYLVFCILILLQLHTGAFKTYTAIKRIQIVGVAIYLGVFVILLSSRVLTISLAMVIAVSLYGITTWRPVYKGIAITVSIFFFMVILFISPVARYRNLQEPFTSETYTSSSGVYQYSTGIRRSLWWLGMQTITGVNPLIGTGTGDVKDEVKKISEQSGEQNIMNTYDPHNQFMFTQIGLGIIGLGTLLACLYLPGWLALREKNYFYLAFILLFTLVCTTESALESQKGIVFFAIFNSLLVFQYGRQSLTSHALVYG